VDLKAQNIDLTEKLYHISLQREEDEDWYGEVGGDNNYDDDDDDVTNNDGASHIPS